MTENTQRELQDLLTCMSNVQLTHLLVEIENGNIEPRSYWMVSQDCGCLYGNAVWRKGDDWEAIVRKADKLKIALTGIQVSQTPLEEELAEQVRYGESHNDNYFLREVHLAAREELATR